MSEPGGLFPDLQPDPGMVAALQVIADRAALSPDARRTARQRDEVKNGRHPLGLAPLAGNGKTCGDCTHRILVDHRSRTYPKCDDHTPSPAGYIAWHTWAARMNRTHRQLRCKGCGRFRIWIPRTPRSNRPAEA